MRRSKSNSGFTLLEAMVSLGILSIVLGGVVMASQRGLGLFRTCSINGEINARAGRAIDRVMRELLSSGIGTIQPDLTTPPGLPTVWSETLDYQAADNWAGGVVVWGTAMQLSLEYAEGELNNNLDDNGDGLVDECTLFLTEDPGGAGEQRVVLVNGVSEFLQGETQNAADDNGNGLEDERGFCVDMNNGFLTVRLSLERLGADGQLLVRTQQDSILLNN